MENITLNLMRKLVDLCTYFIFVFFKKKQGDIQLRSHLGNGVGGASKFKLMGGGGVISMQTFAYNFFN